MTHRRLIQALLYIRGEDGLSARDLQDVLKTTLGEARQFLHDFAKDWNFQNHGLEVLEFNDVFKLATRDEFVEAITNLVTIEKKRRLSDAALETIGIIAYKQPISRSEINQIRGINSEAVVSTLIEKGLVEEHGYAEDHHHAMLYRVTPRFYDYFKLRSMHDLPKLPEFQEMEQTEAAFELFQSQREDNL